jgi:DNA-binding NarL/FixJ family response regulator
MTVSILLVDDHEVFREGLRLLLQSQADFSIVGEATNSQQAITLTKNLHPDVVILDIAMPGLNGLEAIRHIRAAHAHVRVIILSAHIDEHYALRALHLGAVGYVLKEQSAAELIHAIREARQGHPFLSPSIADRVNVLLSAEDGLEFVPEPDFSKRFMLTRREEQVLDLLIQGLINRDIGEKLGISGRTVEVHRTNLMRKLGLKSRGDLERFIQQGKAGGERPAGKDEPASEG